MFCLAELRVWGRVNESVQPFLFFYRDIFLVWSLKLVGQISSTLLATMQSPICCKVDHSKIHFLLLYASIKGALAYSIWYGKLKGLKRSNNCKANST